MPGVAGDLNRTEFGIVQYIIIVTACVSDVKLLLLSIAVEAEVSQTARHSNTAAIVAMTEGSGCVQHFGI